MNNFENIDYIYGGWDQDAMQANVIGNGQAPGDRLMDWVGAYNVYYVCYGAYGEPVITRSLTPGLINFLQLLAEGDGAVGTKTSTTSGFRETGMVFSQEGKLNSTPIHPDHPGHFVCGDTPAAAPAGGTIGAQLPAGTVQTVAFILPAGRRDD